MNIAEVAARAAHEVNNVYNAAIGDLPSPAWDALTDAQRDGVIAGATHAIAGGDAEESHNLWLESRRAEGWTWGPIKNFEARTSPCFLPYGELPEVQRRKDALFQSIVRAVVESLR